MRNFRDLTAKKQKEIEDIFIVKQENLIIASKKWSLIEKRVANRELIESTVQGLKHQDIDTSVLKKIKK